MPAKRFALVRRIVTLLALKRQLAIVDANMHLHVIRDVSAELAVITLECTSSANSTQVATMSRVQHIASLYMVSFYCFVAKHAREGLAQPQPACRGGRRASRSDTLTASEAFERMLWSQNSKS